MHQVPNHEGFLVFLAEIAVPVSGEFELKLAQGVVAYAGAREYISAEDRKRTAIVSFLKHATHATSNVIIGDGFGEGWRDPAAANRVVRAALQRRALRTFAYDTRTCTVVAVTIPVTGGGGLDLSARAVCYCT